MSTAKIIGFIKRKKFLLLIVLILVGAVFGFIKFQQSKSNDNVETYVVTRGEVKEELILSGTISADEYVKLHFPVSGKISWVGVKEGQEVNKGQALMKLDTTSLNADYQRAQSDLRAAEASVQKVHDDVKDHSGDETFAQKEDRTTAEVAKDKAYEAVKKAQENLRDATLYSPFTGFITYIANPFSGLNVFSTQDQIEILNPNTIYFDVTADQTEVVNISVGQSVEVVLDPFSGKKFSGIVSYVSLTPKSGDVGASYKVKVTFNENLGLDVYKIGMTGDAKFNLSKKTNVLYAPSAFINSDKTGKYVNFSKPGNKVYVETGLEGEDSIEIVNGVNEGDTLYD